MFLNNPSIPPGVVARYDYIQAAEAAVMEDLFAKYIAALIVERGQGQLSVQDLDIAGGGDGHTFVVRSLVIKAAVPMGGNGWDVRPTIQGRFWMGSDAEALESYQEAAIASLRGTGNDLTRLAVGLAGAAKGTRFMAFAAAIVS